MFLPNTWQQDAHSAYFHFTLLHGDSNISDTVAETTQAIWQALQHEYIPVPKTEQWKSTSY
jgi:hypothetical protein